MLAQVYYNNGSDDKGIVASMRIFDKNELMLAEAPLETLDEADEALKRLRMKRREKWLKTDWGKEAKIRFNLS